MARASDRQIHDALLHLEAAMKARDERITKLETSASTLLYVLDAYDEGEATSATVLEARRRLATALVEKEGEDG